MVEMPIGARRVLRDWDVAGSGRSMDFRLTYAGRLHSHKDNERLRERSLHVHEIRRCFHRQLRELWTVHPTLRQVARSGSSVDFAWSSEDRPLGAVYEREGYNWLPLVTEENGLVCNIDVLMLRHGEPGKVVFDVDNRLKTLFDALRMAKSPYELGLGTENGQLRPAEDEHPFFTVLEDDRLITGLAVSTDTLLEPVPGVIPEEAVRLVVGISIRPYRGSFETIGFA